MSRNLIASAATKANLEKLINEYYLSNSYVVTEDNRIYNTKRENYLDGARVVVKRNRWRFERV